MNITNLQIQLQTAIENATAQATLNVTNDTVYYLQLAKAIQSLNMGQIRTVATFINLPSAVTHEGWLIFVEADERLYYSDGVNWSDITVVYSNTLWGWGANDSGQIGSNSITARSSPVSVVGGFTDWRQVSAGADFSIGLRQNSTLWSWGYGSFGRLGNNTTTDRSSPVSVVGGFTDWCQVSAGYQQALAVRRNGTAWAWGNNALNTFFGPTFTGQLGDNTTIAKSSPVSVVGGFTDWCQVSAGDLHTLGIRQNGTAWAWGYNSLGQLGNNTGGYDTHKSSPVSVVGGFLDWCQVSAGNNLSLGVRKNGTLWAWGYNDTGQLGDNTIVNKSSPVSVVGGFTDWCQVSASRHSLGVRQNGTAWAWGFNGEGVLGNNTTTNRSSPVSVVGGFLDWCQVSAGRQHSLAIRQNGTVWAWGSNFLYGQLGDNTTTDRSSPVSVVGGFTDWSQVSAGKNHSMAIRRTST